MDLPARARRHLALGLGGPALLTLACGALAIAGLLLAQWLARMAART